MIAISKCRGKIIKAKKSEDVIPASYNKRIH